MGFGRRVSCLIINADAKQLQLEVNVAAYLSQDPILLEEVRNKVDIHEENRIRFGLPSRLIAKKFKFRLIYGGSAYSYANDPEFAEVKYNQRQWQDVIDEYYNKYKGLAGWHRSILQEVIRSGYLRMPTGRIFEYNRDQRGNWPETTIKNYPVQGTGADIMSIIRISFRKKWLQNNIKGKRISTVHDSIVVDVPSKEQDRVVQMFYDVYKEMPNNFEKLFKVKYNLPIFCEVSIGNNLYDLKEL